MSDAVEAIKTQGGKYLVCHPMVQYSVESESLKRMRCRYLLASKKQQAQQSVGLFDKLRQAAEQAVGADAGSAEIDLEALEAELHNFVLDHLENYVAKVTK